ncbi:MAG: MerR family transcriptional regulator [Chloroflexi bacterium]|nr:MAG: MerR family transcriptional regulator [Chloroflexota bacterium]MBL1197290.1 MerR family transcriptional regulator [Chloroflexota bacterium]NOH14585.1 MerR family transcriptional regulator [Chloroflexota bacterium]
MTQISTTPTYNLKVIIQETGIKPDTLRAWERRYGLPAPGRTEGGHRLYSDYDIETIKWLLVRQEEGLSISRAVQLWNNLLEQEDDPLEAMPYGGQSQARRLSPDYSDASTLEEIRQSWVAACLQFDESAAERILAQAFARYPLETVCIEVLRQGISDIGQLWFQNEASVQQEHFASALAMRRLNALLAAAPQPTRRGRILVACPPQEQHTFAALLISVLLRYSGRDVVYLGADVPLGQLVETLDTVKPQLVIMPAMLLHTAANLLDVALTLQDHEVELAYGGPIFISQPSLQERIPGHFLGGSFEGSLSTIEQILAKKQSAPSIKKATKKHLAVLEHYRQHQAQLEAAIVREASEIGLEHVHLNLANTHLTQDIEAALRFGDMDQLKPALDWVQQLTANYDLPPDLLGYYLKAYHYAAEHTLGEQGQPVIDWLEQFSGKE